MSGKYITLDEGSLSEYEVYEHHLNGYGVLTPVSFNVDWVPMGQREWLLKILDDSFNRVTKEAHEAGKAEVRRQMRKALGL